MIGAKHTLGWLLIAALWAGATASAQAPMPLAENFDSDPLGQWHFSCQKELISEGTGRALRASGAGHALWLVQAKDFTLSFRYRYQPGKGTGDVVFRVSGTPPNTQMYSLRLEPSQLVLCRRIRTQAQGFQEQQLAAASFPLRPGTWHNFTLKAAGGQFNVAVDGKQVLNAQDPQPLSPGLVGLGVIAGSGSVDYDDAVFTPGAPASSTPTPTPTTTPPTPGASMPTPATAPPMPTTPAPMPTTPPPATGTDLAVTDIFADRLKNGRLWVRITNHGPRRIRGTAELVTVVNRQRLTHFVPLNLAPGKTATHNTGRLINAARRNQHITATVRVPGMKDPRPANNTYKEIVTRKK